MQSKPSSLSRSHPLLREAMMAKMMSDLLKVHDQVRKALDELAQHANTIKNLPKGDKGDTPQIDYAKIVKTVLSSIRVPEDGKTPDEEVIVEKIAKRIRQPEDGKTPIINESKIVDRVLKLMPPVTAPSPEIDHEVLADIVVQKIADGKKFKVEHVSGLKEEVASYRNQLAGKVYGKDTWARGGGDTVAAGSGIAISTDTNGKVVITNTSTGGFTTLAPTETPDGSTTVFTFAAATAQPSFIISDNVWLQAVTKKGTINWTWNAGLKQATMTVPPQDAILGIV